MAGRADVRRRRSFPRIRRVLVVGVTAPCLLFGGQLALATFTSTGSASHEVSTATLAPPSNPSTQHGACTHGVSTSVVVNWTKTPSTWADGYEVFVSLVGGGPYTSAGTVAGRDTETMTVNGLHFLTSYYFVVKATKGNWRSVPTTEAVRTTLCT